MLYHLPLGGGPIDPNPTGSTDPFDIELIIVVLIPFIVVILARILRIQEDKEKKAAEGGK